MRNLKGVRGAQKKLTHRRKMASLRVTRQRRQLKRTAKQ